MAYQDHDDPVNYHREAITFFEHKIEEMRHMRCRHYHAASGERLYEVTEKVLAAAEQRRKVHETLLVLTEAQHAAAS